MTDKNNNGKCILSGKLVCLMDECPTWQYDSRDKCHSDCCYYIKFEIPIVGCSLHKPIIIEHPFGDDEII